MYFYLLCIYVLLNVKMLHVHKKTKKVIHKIKIVCYFALNEESE